MDIDANSLRRYAAENLGGFVSGSVMIICGQPFDTVKVRLQAGHTAYKGALDCVKTTVRTEGPRSLFKGMLSPLLANSAMNAVTFSTWQEAQRLFHFEDGSEAPLEKVFLAGSIAGVVQCSIATPMELVRSKLQVQHEGVRAYSGNLDCIKKLYASEGVGGLYRGNVSMVLREAPAFGVPSRILTWHSEYCVLLHGCHAPQLHYRFR
jgi:solute carrier family 25 carnitine/acylcarnitine transporter 20/29